MQGDSRDSRGWKKILSNYPDTDNMLKRAEQAISDLREKVNEIIRIIIELEERITPAVEAQRIRDVLDGIWVSL